MRKWVAYAKTKVQINCGPGFPLNFAIEGTLGLGLNEIYVWFLFHAPKN